MHFHRDMLAICDTYGAHVLRRDPDDIFFGSAADRLHLRAGRRWCCFRCASAPPRSCWSKPRPMPLLEAIRTHAADSLLHRADRLSRHAGHAAAERCRQPAHLRLGRRAAAGADLGRVAAATGIAIIDGIGATEMLHIFIAAPVDEIRPGATGMPVPGYQAKLIDDDGSDVPRGTRRPPGCRARPAAAIWPMRGRREYVQKGWNVTGDTYHQDDDGYFWFQARSDDMILSSGYNIAGPEVEAALLTHPAVAECARSRRTGCGPRQDREGLCRAA